MVDVHSVEYFMQYTRIKLTITNRRGIYPHLPIKAYLKPGVHFTNDVPVYYCVKL